MRQTTSSAGWVVLLLLVLLLVLLCIFLKCRKTKSGPELEIRFTNLAFGLSSYLPADSLEPSPEVAVERKGSARGYGNPCFDSPVVKVQASLLTAYPTPEKHIGLWESKDTDSAFQEPASAVRGGSSLFVSTVHINVFLILHHPRPLRTQTPSASTSQTTRGFSLPIFIYSRCPAQSH